MLHKCCEILLLLNFAVLCHFSILNNESKQQTEILNSISSANKVLQELIDNYEKVQDTNNFKEYSSENDGKLKILLYDKGNTKQRNRAYKKPEKPSVSTSRPGTVGIYESRSLESTNIDDIDITYPKRIETNTRPINNNYNDDNEKNKETSDKEIDAVSTEYDNSEDIEEIPIEMPFKSEVKQETNNKVLKSYNKPKVIQNLLGEKTRFSIKSFNHQNKTKNRLLRIFEFPFKGNSRRVKKIVYSEKFSPNNIWQEIISKPIKLNKDVDPFFKQNDEPRFRSNDDDKVTIFIFRKHLGRDSKEKITKQSSSNMVLRNYYGTCLQVPIKKCHKVIAEASKRTCRRFKCETEFKNEFERHGRNECTLIFANNIKSSNNDKVETTTQRKIEPLKLGEIKHRDSIFSRSHRNRNSNLHKDMVKSKVINLRNETPESLAKHTSLRDKYEVECQRELRDRCLKVCENAIEKSCTTTDYVCSDTKKKGFKDTCRDECKRAFFIRTSLGSSSDFTDSSDSDSDSNSDSDSDSR